MSNDTHEYSLQRYAGRNTRHTCPKCGKPHCFSLYVDQAGNPLSAEVGRCDHESSCAYHKTPKEYFEQHPDTNKDSKAQNNPAPKPTKKQNQVKKPLCTIPTEIMERSVRLDIPSTFTIFLLTLFPQETVTSLIKRYRLGVTKSRDIIYYQIDTKGKVRTGKIMKYNPQTGKRIKDSDTPYKINWVHSVMRHTGHLPSDWELTQCLFGEHLLADPAEKDKTIALVESEKSAIIASAIMPKYIWLATGGKSQLKAEKLSVLQGRKVIAFPDVDAFAEWNTKLPALEGLSITVSDVLERNATDRERYAHIDIADWLIRWRSETKDEYRSIDPISAQNTDTTPEAEHDPLANPSFQLISPYIQQKYHTELALLMDDLDLIPNKISTNHSYR